MMRKLLTTFLLCFALLNIGVAQAQEQSSQTTNVDFAKVLPLCEDTLFRRESVNLAKIRSYCKVPAGTCGEFKPALDEAKETLEASRESQLSEPISLAAQKFIDETVSVNQFCSNQDLAITATKSTAEDIKDAVRTPSREASGSRDFCVEIGSNDTSICEALDPKKNAEDKEFQKFADLSQAVTNGELITILEEPIGNEKLFNRARVCQLQFVRGADGNLQKINKANTSTPNSDPLNISGHYAVEISECESYVVPVCQPTGGVISSIELVNSGEGKHQLKVDGEVQNHLPLITFCDQVQILHGGTGIDLLKSYVGFLYRWAAGFAGVIAVVVIMFSGIQISAANGDSGVVDEAKARIIQSITALALLFFSGMILYAVNPTFFQDRDVAKIQDDIKNGKINEQIDKQNNEAIQRESSEFERQRNLDNSGRNADSFAPSSNTSEIDID